MSRSPRFWVPSPTWDGGDAYVVGGGPSLRGFDWSRIRGHHVVGCNSAFLLGEQVVRVVVFGDKDWWLKVGRDGVAKLPYRGLVVGCTREPLPVESGLLQMERLRYGLAEAGSGRLAWNHNTGSLAVNLALSMGARRVFLLGFDMALSEQGDANWHSLRYEPAKSEVYSRFRDGFDHVACHMPRLFPGCEVWNVTDASGLQAFPKVSLAEHFKKEVPCSR